MTPSASPFGREPTGVWGREKSDTGILPVILSILAAALAAALNHRLEARVTLGRLPPHRLVGLRREPR